MYSLISGFIEHSFKTIKYKVLFLGLDTCGKTVLFLYVSSFYFKTIVDRLISYSKGIIDPPIKKVFQTVGMNVDNINYSNKTLILWDIGGDRSLRTLWNKYFNECNMIVYVIDVSNIERFDESLKEIETLLQNISLETTPLLIVANKVDLISDSPDICCRILLALSRPIPILQVSAAKSSGISSLISWIIDSTNKVNNQFL